MDILSEQPHHAAAIEQLLDVGFGPGRHRKTVYRLREGVAPVPGLSLVALDGDELVGTLRFWPVTIAGTAPALLLGPIAIALRLQGQGVGAALIGEGLARARALGHRIVLLVGDAPYYGRFGFARNATLALSLPGPVDPDRFLGLELVPGALTGVAGEVGRAETRAATAAAPAALARTAVGG